MEWGSKYSEYCDWLETQLDQFCESQGCTVEEVFTKLKECMKGENSSFVRALLLTLATQNNTHSLNTDADVHAEHGVRTLSGSDEILCDSKENGETGRKSCGGQEG